jgi:hypothetical protein
MPAGAGHRSPCHPCAPGRLFQGWNMRARHLTPYLAAFGIASMLAAFALALR